MTPNHLFYFILACALVGVVAYAIRLALHYPGFLAGDDGEIEHVEPNDNPELSPETKSTLLGLGMAEQHKRHKT